MKAEKKEATMWGIALVVVVAGLLTAGVLIGSDAEAGPNYERRQTEALEDIAQELRRIRAEIRRR